MAERNMQSADRLSIAMESLQVIVLEINTGGEITYAHIGNELASAIEEKNLIGNTIGKVFNTDHFVDQLFKQAINTGNTVKGILSHQTTYFETQFRPIKDNNNQVIKVMVVGTDATEKLLSKQKLINSEVKLNTFVNNIPGLVLSFIINKTEPANISYISNGVEWLFETTVTEMRNNTALFWNKIHPDDVDMLNQSIQQAATTIHKWECVWRLVHSNNSIKWLLGQGTPQMLADGSVVLDAILLDITDRKMAESKLEQSFFELSLIDKINTASLNNADIMELATHTLDAYEKLTPIISARFYAYHALSSELSLIKQTGINQAKKEENQSIKNVGSPLFGNDNFNHLVSQQKIIALNGKNNIKQTIAQSTNDIILKKITEWVDTFDNLATLVIVPLTQQQKIFGLVLLVSNEPLQIEQLSLIERFNKQVRTALSKSMIEHDQRQMADIVESTDVAIISKDLKGNITSWNKGAEKLFGYKAEEVLTQSGTQIIPTQLLWEDQELIKMVKAGVYMSKHETKRKRKDGTEIDVALIISPVVNRHRKVVGISKVFRDISESKQTQVMLKHNEERLSNVLSIIGEGVWEWDLKTNKIWNNERWCQLMGIKENNSQHDLDFIKSIVHPDDLVEMFKQVQLCLNGKCSFFSEHRIIANDGRIIWINDRGDVTERDEQGNPLKMAGSIVDVTQRKLYETQLKESSDLLDKLTNQIPGMLFQLMLNAEGQLSVPYASDGVMEIYEHTPEQLKRSAGQLLRYIHSNDLNTVKQNIEKSAQTLQTLQLEFRVELPKQGLKWRSVVARPERLSDGSTLWHGYVTDISNRKKTDTALIESEKNLQTIFELSPIPLLITKLYDGTLIMANEATEVLFGFNVRDVIGKHGLSFFMDDASQERLQNEMAKKGKVTYMELAMKTALQKPLTCLVSCEIIYINGEVALISSIQNISERKKFEEELINKNRELKKTNIELDRFVYSTSHDLRAPLLSVLGLVDICESYHPDNSELQNLYGMMRTSIHRSDDTIKSILDYSRNSRIDPQPEQLNVRLIVQTHIENIRHMVEAKNIQFSVNINEQIAFYADKMRFVTIVNNLITNATKYQRADEPNQSVHITFNCENGIGKLQVTDNGEGIKPEKLDKVFGMFVRLSTKSSGSGLGLYMCKEMSEKMGGTIQVNSTYQSETTFTVLLPNHNPNL